VAGTDVCLFPGAKAMLTKLAKLKASDNSEWAGTKFAVASRTNSVDWAHLLLSQFGLKDLMDYIELFPGNKLQHFEKLHQSSQIPYSEMMFFDDARDGKYGNCVPVSSLGVLCVHTPKGITEESIFDRALRLYREEWDGGKHSIVERDGSISQKAINAATKQVQVQGARMKGVIKKVNADRGFGFIEVPENEDVFFHFNNLNKNDANRILNKGDKLSFVTNFNASTGKSRAVDIRFDDTFAASTRSSKLADASSPTADPSDLVELHAFSMNLPFAALLANGYKTLETRNGTMFSPYPAGTLMLLHVGQRLYPDANKHLEIMTSDADNVLTDKRIKELKSLPKGYGKGQLVAICELGKTYVTTLDERCDAEFQRKVGAYGADSGRFATEIKRVAYLESPNGNGDGSIGGVKLSGRGGVFKVKVDKNVIPDGWIE